VRSASVRLWEGEKIMTKHLPVTASARRRRLDRSWSFSLVLECKVDGLTFGVYIWLVLCLLFFHRTVVIDEYESLLIFGVDVALHALVSGT
jgi:hypothetical protein